MMTSEHAVHFAYDRPLKRFVEKSGTNPRICQAGTAVSGNARPIRPR